MLSKNDNKQFYGTTILGEKGQVVIPAEARKALDIKKGEKLLVFGMGREMIVFCKLSKIEKIASHLSRKLEIIRRVIKKSR